MTDFPERKPEKDIEQVVQQFVDAQLRGENPDIDEFVKRYPGLENRIRQRIHNLREIDGLFASLMQPDENDFQDTPAEHNLIGQKLGDFEIVKLIGRGGMGAVFLARQISLDRDVALKVVSDISGARGKSLERFKREAKVLAKISHPNIVPIYEVGEQGPYSYFAMEHIKGISLDKILAGIRNAKPSDKASDIMHKCLESQAEIYDGKQQTDSGTVAEIDTAYIVNISKMIVNIASALDYAHKIGILHRDVKPSNILIDSTGTPKLVDFGLARVETQQTITISGEFFGTPNYVSPEQINKPESVDCRSDVYSLAATYYECLTLHPPFEGNTVNETLTRVISREAVPPKKYCPRLSTDFNTVLLHALEKSSQDRYQNAADFAADIENVLEFKPITAKRPSITRRTLKTLRRSPLKAAFGVAIFCIIGMVYFVYSGYCAKIEQERLDKIQKLTDDADLLLCQAALNTEPWPAIGFGLVAERAIERYDEVLRLDEDNQWALIQRGIAQLVKGNNLDLARTNFDKAEKLGPDFYPMPYLKAKVNEQYGTEELKDVNLVNIRILNAKEAYVLGLLALQQANPPENEREAKKLFSICVGKDSNFFPGLVAKAFVNVTSGEDNIGECQTLCNLRPDSAFVHLLIGHSLSLLKSRQNEAIVPYKRALELQPWNPQCYAILGTTYRDIGMYEEAENHLVKAFELDNSCDASIDLASFYCRTQKNYEKAIIICDEGLSKQCNLVRENMILDTKILALEQIGDKQKLKECLKQKEDCLRQLIEKPGGKQDQWLHVELLKFLCDNDRQTEAVEFFKRMQKEKPQFRFPLGRALGEDYESHKEYYESIALYQALYEEIKIEGINQEGYDSSV